MARQPARRALNGKRRRKSIRKVRNNSRWMHLYHDEVCIRHKIQSLWILHTILAQQTLLFLMQLIIFKVLIFHQIANPINPNTDVAVDLFIQILNIECSSYQSIVYSTFTFDHLIWDITPEEEALDLEFTPCRNIRFDSWDDQKCLNYTSFRKHELMQIYRHFNLVGMANQQDGLVRIATGHAYYAIHPEELFLFFMTRFKKGFTIHDLVNDVFGGDHNRWYYAWPWMLRYLDDRYENIIGHQGLLRFIDDFPDYFTAIENYVKKAKYHRYNDGTEFESPGLAFCPFRIFGWIDCSIYSINVPFSGPFGDYKGAPRKPLFHLMQRAFYTGFTKLHGVKVETVYLPNGISTVFGPVSCRRRDIAVNGGASVADLSGISQFLRLVQQNKYNPSYSVFGDCIYGCGLDCIVSYYRSRYNHNDMDDWMRVCDAEMRDCRESIEWDYGKKATVFRICTDPNQYKLGKQNPVSTCFFEFTSL